MGVGALYLAGLRRLVDVMWVEPVSTVPSTHPVLRACEQHLGEAGAQLFLAFIGFSGLPTGRLFAWAQSFKALMNPAGQGTCEGKLVRADLSKWKKLVRSDGVTKRVTAKTDLELTACDFALKAGSDQLFVFVVFERESETLLVSADPKALEPLAMVARIVDLEAKAVEKLKLPRGQARRNLIWMPDQDTYRAVRANLCRDERSAAREACAERAQAHARAVKALEWWGRKLLIHPGDWTCQRLETGRCPATYELTQAMTLADVRAAFLRFVRAFNAPGRMQRTLRGAVPSIKHVTRLRDVEERLSV